MSGGLSGVLVKDLAAHEDKGRQKKLLGKNVHFEGETSSGAAMGHESLEL